MTTDSQTQAHSQTEPGAHSAALPTERGSLMKLATYASVAVATFLIGIKLAAWLITDSVALLSTMIDSLLDAGASIVTLLAVRQSLVPADQDHRFGHGKAEPLAGLAQSAFIAGSAVFLMIEAVPRFLRPVPVQEEGIGMVVMVISIVITGLLVLFQRHVVRSTGSLAIGADSAHYTGDVLINLSVIVSLVLASQLGLLWADPLFAVGIAGYLCWTAWGIATEAFDILMDRELPEEDRETILRIARDQPQVWSVHDLRTRSSGSTVFIQLHLEIDGTMPLSRAHAVADQVENRLLKAFPDADIIIHQDPKGIKESRHPDFAYESSEKQDGSK
ncbi:MAG: cation diffusion facilitator family transporter [Rhodospirillaceae bacterium]